MYAPRSSWGTKPFEDGTGFLSIAAILLNMAEETCDLVVKRRDFDGSSLVYSNTLSDPMDSFPLVVRFLLVGMKLCSALSPDFSPS